MSRRRSLPGAEELFRSTGETAGAAQRSAGADDSTPVGRADPVLAEQPVSDEQPAGNVGEAIAAKSPARRRSVRLTSARRTSGRERHDEKITVYVSDEELLDLEHARLTLRGDHGLAVDRGRIVREALAFVLADFDAKGDASILVRRVRSR